MPNVNAAGSADRQTIVKPALLLQYQAGAAQACYRAADRVSGWGRWRAEARVTAAPPPHPTMSRARNVTDPIKRNMMIPLRWFADGDHLSLKAPGRA